MPAAAAPATAGSRAAAVGAAARFRQAKAGKLEAKRKEVTARVAAAQNARELAEQGEQVGPEPEPEPEPT